jgi:hypothetical protein
LEGNIEDQEEQQIEELVEIDATQIDSDGELYELEETDFSQISTQSPLSLGRPDSAISLYFYPPQKYAREILCRLWELEFGIRFAQNSDLFHF